MVNPDAKLQMQLSESDFRFSKRMLNFFDALQLKTIGDLASIPLHEITCFRGFKAKCKQELINFIESQGIEELFEDFHIWK